MNARFHRELAQVADLSIEQRAPVSESDELTREQEMVLARRGIRRSSDRQLEMDNSEAESSDEEQPTILDVLGRYFSATRQIVLYTKMIELCAESLEVSEQVLHEVVLAHEIAHAVTHFGTEVDGAIWEYFSCAATEDKELLAQLLPCVLFASQGMIEHLEVMEKLSLHQSSRYNTYKKHRDDSSADVIKLVRELRRKAHPHQHFSIFIVRKWADGRMEEPAIIVYQNGAVVENDTPRSKTRPQIPLPKRASDTTLRRIAELIEQALEIDLEAEMIVVARSENKFPKENETEVEPSLLRKYFLLTEATHIVSIVADGKDREFQSLGGFFTPHKAIFNELQSLVNQAKEEAS